jgi:hypothetical protein
MVPALQTMLDLLFADKNLAKDAVYTAKGGVPMLVRVVTRRADEITGFGEARIWSETTRFDLLVAEVPSPRPGDRIELDGEAFLIQGRWGGCRLPQTASQCATKVV